MHCLKKFKKRPPRLGLISDAWEGLADSASHLEPILLLKFVLKPENKAYLVRNIKEIGRGL